MSVVAGLAAGTYRRSMAPAIDRYHRQRLLASIGDAGQRRLGEAHVLIAGVGALGCHAADLLARAGIGRLTLVDRDVVELSNLQRQSLFAERDVGTPKAEAGRRRLDAVNAQIRVEGVIADLTHGNVESVALAGPLGRVDVVVDGTDNFETRLLLNDLAVKHGLAYVYGGAVGTSGTVMTILPGRTACLRCVLEDLPAAGSQPTCDTAGVFGPLIADVGAQEAREAIRVVVAAPGVHDGRTRLTQFDGWTGERRTLTLAAGAPGCPCCVGRSFPHLEREGDVGPTPVCGRRAVQIAGGAARVDLEVLAARLDGHGRFDATRFLVRGRLAEEDLGLTVFADGRAIVDGTTDPARARTVYARYVGS